MIVIGNMHDSLNLISILTAVTPQSVFIVVVENGHVNYNGPISLHYRSDDSITVKSSYFCMVNIATKTAFGMAR
jgi:hypothetical protein